MKRRDVTDSVFAQRISLGAKRNAVVRAWA